MKMVMPITDYVVKSTYAIEQFFTPYFSSPVIESKGHLIDAPAENCVMRFRILPNIYTLEDVVLLCMGVNADVSQTVGFYIRGGSDNADYDDWATGLDRETINLNGVDKYATLSLQSYFSLSSPGDNIHMIIVYDAVPTVTNLYVCGVIVKYSLT